MDSEGEEASFSDDGAVPPGAEQRGLNLSLCLCLLAYPFFLEGRTQKEKKAARARSKGKNSDEEAPKAAQKKLKLVRT